jgi:hypothetical protein
MEAALSVFCAVAGLFCGLAFLRDYISLAAGGTGKWLRVAVKLLLTLVLLHFHFELEMLD